MRKIIAMVLAVVACGASLTLTTASDAVAAGRSPQCVKVRKFFNRGHQRYVRLTNLCAGRAACYVIVLPHRPDPRGRLAKAATRDIRYGTTTAPRALYVKNTRC
ncbi:hypothetical protein EYS09_33170 [Streptomyces kasugaensis]|uniref:Beta-Ig-H3/fasciclin n=1 Tax=Streptomyces kasugaensis TaxID=1946 RepID=A0A4V2JHP9_STRKA|nr:hypothetical protein [Streptomyces kasugaensis]TBO55461.1 hypothetical protein EYS09_33170 [Streptomyces kasugaensis]